jgi:hypothetical protein
MSPSGSPASASPVATATAPPVIGDGAPDPVTAVKDVTGAEGFCVDRNYVAPPCPVTQRLGERLAAAPMSGSAGGADPVCRCQNLGTPVFKLTSPRGGDTAVVSEDRGFGPPLLRWTLIKVAGSWYVDDQDMGCSATSIYSAAYDHGSTAPAPAC